MTDRSATRVPRYRPVLLWTLSLVVVGLLTAEPVVLAAAAVPLSVVLYGALSGLPPEVALETERRLAEGSPTPGEAVTVTLTVENAGGAPLTDVRVVDGVPDELAVVDGSPRGCLSLAAGEAATISYDVVAKRGTYRFGAPVARTRSLAATAVATTTVDVSGATELTCANAVSRVPLANATLPRSGTLPTDSGGTGVEFHATRAYQAGDPLRRIDWRRFAKTNELTTVEYREEQAVRTVLVVDARPPARVSPAAGYPTGAEMSAYAAERLFDALGRASVVTSVVGVGLADRDVVGGVDPDGLAWVDPDGDGHVAARAATVFDGVGAAAARPDDDARARTGDDAATPDGGRSGAGPDASRGFDDGTSRGFDDGTSGGFDDGTDDGFVDTGDETVWTIVERLPPRAQVVVFTPLLDDWPLALVRALAVRDYPTTVVSPDVTRGGERAGDAPARRVLALERDVRLRRGELAGATTIDWQLDDPIDVALRASLADLYQL